MLKDGGKYEAIEQNEELRKKMNKEITTLLDILTDENEMIKTSVKRKQGCNYCIYRSICKDVKMEK